MKKVKIIKTSANSWYEVGNKFTVKEYSSDCYITLSGSIIWKDHCEDVEDSLFSLMFRPANAWEKKFIMFAWLLVLILLGIAIIIHNS